MYSYNIPYDTVQRIQFNMIIHKLQISVQFSLKKKNNNTCMYKTRTGTLVRYAFWHTALTNAHMCSKV